MDAPPCDTGACNSGQFGPVSNRLVSGPVAREIRDKKEAMGLANQTREDHAPFTVDRTDQNAFLQKLKRDQSENPQTVEKATTLVWI